MLYVSISKKSEFLYFKTVANMSKSLNNLLCLLDENFTLKFSFRKFYESVSKVVGYLVLFFR